jgi:CubicO group peptidase (beta-lactamase class C family)
MRITCVLVLIASVTAALDAVADDAIDGVRQDLKVLESFGLSGAVLIADKDRTLLAEGYGAPCDNPGDRIATKTLFDIGSLAKQFTAAAILLLETEGKLAVSDSVARFFPSAPPPIGTLTIHQLLAHTSGLPKGNLITEETTETDPLSRDSTLARVFRSKLRFPAGSDRAYSNAGYVLLAAIVEEASGMSYPGFVRERLWQPAHMPDARFWGEPAEDIACGKDDLGVVSDPRKFPEENWSLRGAGGALVHVEDLHHWFDALMKGRVLPAETVRRMMSSQAGPFGYAWRLGPLRGDSTSVFHGGDYYGFGSQLIWQPRVSRLIIILTNIRHEDDTYPTRIRVEDVILGRLDGSPATLPRLEPAQGARQLKTGIFRSPDGAGFRIDRVGTSLFLGAIDQEGTSFLSPTTSPDTTAYRAALTERTARVIAAALANDSTAVRLALSSQDDPPYVLEQLAQELDGRLHGRQAEVVGLGTYPAATPAGALWSVVELHADSDTTHYMLRWYRDLVGSYHLRAPSVAARLFVVPSGSGWLAWDIVRSSTIVQIESVGADGDQLRLANGVRQLVVDRVQQ